MGKDDSCKVKDLSKNLFSVIKELINNVQDIVGSRILYLECENIEKLKNLYEKEGFRYLQDNGDLIQMVRII
jgi:hypothetical protein